MLTYRQVSLLNYLAQAVLPIHVEVLADLFEVSERTIQTEIHSLNHFLPSSKKIITHPGLGYELQGDSKEIKKLIQTQPLQGTRRHPTRAGQIIDVLSRSKGYQSLEQVADQLYISKATLSYELSNNWRLRRIVEVSPQHGLRLTISEYQVRLTLAHLTSPLLDDPKYAILHARMNDLFIRLDLQVTERSFKDWLNYCLIASKRLDLYPLDTSLHQGPSHRVDSSLLDEIHQVLEEVTNKTWSNFDLQGLAQQFSQLSFTNLEKRVAWSLNLDDVTVELENLQDYLETTHHISWGWNDAFRNHLFMFLNAMTSRYQNQTFQPNFNKRRLNREYLLTAQLLKEYHPKFLPHGIREADFASLIPFFAAEWEKIPMQVQVQVVTDASLSDAEWIQQILTQVHLSYPIQAIILQRADQPFPIRSSENSYSLRLVIGSQDFLLKYSCQLREDLPLILAPLTGLKNQLPWLQSQMQTLLDKHLQAIQRKQQEKLRAHHLSTHIVKDPVESLEDLFARFDFSYDQSSYELLVSDSIGYYSTMRTDQPSQIYIISLSHALHLHNRSLDYIVLSNYNNQDQSLHSFYALIQELIIDKKLVKYFK